MSLEFDCDFSLTYHLKALDGNVRDLLAYVMFPLSKEPSAEDVKKLHLMAAKFYDASVKLRDTVEQRWPLEESSTAEVTKEAFLQ